VTRDLLTEHQARVADRVLDEEATRREHLVVSLSGAHAYGFPSPDSDLDLKCVHHPHLGAAPPGAARPPARRAPGGGGRRRGFEDV
jgi:RNA repair pathway DNA polymerase beta family